MEHNLEFNPIRVVGIFLIIAILIWYSPIHGVIIPEPKVINQTKLIYINQTTTVLVTPTPDGKTYWANEYQSGIRKLSNPYSYIDYHTSDGVSDNNAFKLSINVYDYRMFNYIHVFNPSDYKYYIYPPNDGYKFLFVFVDISIDEVISDNIRIWLPSSDKFLIQYNNQLYSEFPDDSTKQIRIRELENVPTINKEEYIQYYGQRRQYDISYTHSAGEYSEKSYYLYEGSSNRINGYILYEIPIGAEPDDIYVNANFGGFGKSSWKLSGF